MEPIFNSLLREYHFSGRYLPWIPSDVPPKDTGAWQKYFSLTYNGQRDG